MPFIIRQQVGFHFVSGSEEKVIVYDISPGFVVEGIGQPGEPAFVHFIGVIDGCTEIEAFDGNASDGPVLVNAEDKVVPDGRERRDILPEGITEQVTRKFADQAFSFEDEAIDARPGRKGILSSDFDFPGNGRTIGLFLTGLGMAGWNNAHQQYCGTEKNGDREAYSHVVQALLTAK
jgi:hypothetical protein